MTGKVFTVLWIVIVILMGTPLQPNEPAVPCALCWGVGQPFGEGATPHVIQVRLTKLLPGEHWNPDHESLLLQTHYLVSVPGPCAWRVEDSVFAWTASFDALETKCTVRRIADNKPAFVANFPPPCTVDMGSSLIQDLGNVAYNGFANITWDLEGLE